MSYPAPPTSSLQSTEIIGQGALARHDDKPQWQSPRTALIHILDDDSLLNIFSLYRPAIFDDDDNDDDRISGGKPWDRERWWHQLTHVCQRWRYIILGSASHLHLSLVCTWGTPVADMLAHSPPLPLVVDYIIDEDRDITAEDEERIFLALEQHHRVRRIRLEMPILNIQKFIIAMDEEYPVLEYLIIRPSEENSTALILPETLQAPHLRHLALSGFALPMGSRLLTTVVGLVTLALGVVHPSGYFQPNTLLQWVSVMPQLEKLWIIFTFPVPNRDVERQLMNTPIVTHITLPNLRRFAFGGVSAYMEAVVRRITAPRLEKLVIGFFKQLTFSIPGLLQFMNTTESLRFDSAKFLFSGDEVGVGMYPPDEIEVHALEMYVDCLHLDWQVFSVAQIFNLLRQMFSMVEHLTFEHKVHSQSSEEHNEVDRTEWRKLLKSFSNAKTLRVGEGLIKELSCSLRPDDGELPLELLPELQKLTYFGDDNIGDAFTPFVDARQKAGRPVTLVRPSPRSETPLSRSPSPGVLESSDVLTGSVEAGGDLDLDS